MGRISGISAQQIQGWLTLGIEADATLYTTAGPTTLFTDDIVTDDQQISYRVTGRARRVHRGSIQDYYAWKIVTTTFSGNDARDSNVATQQKSNIPVAPSGLIASGAAPSVVLAWNPVFITVFYRVFRGLSSGAETLLASGVIANSFTDTTASQGTQYFYYVTAVNGFGTSIQSNETSITA